MIKDIIINREFLRANNSCVFVFGDNLARKGRGGAALLRDEPNTYGFITKKYPDNNDVSFYTIEEYVPLFNYEMSELDLEIRNNRDKVFLLTRLGSGLANKYKIFETIIWPKLKMLKEIHPNVLELWYEVRD